MIATIAETAENRMIGWWYDWKQIFNDPSFVYARKKIYKTLFCKNTRFRIPATSWSYESFFTKQTGERSDTYNNIMGQFVLQVKGLQDIIAAS